MIEKDLKSCFRVKKMISTSERRAEHPFAGRNTQQLTFSPFLRLPVKCILRYPYFAALLKTSLVPEKTGEQSGG